MAATPNGILPPDALSALYDRLNSLIRQARELQISIGDAMAEDRRRDQQRVSPERKAYDRAHAHDGKRRPKP